MYQTEDESGVTRSIIDQLHSSYIQGDQMERESGVTRSIFEELILWISKEIIGQVKVVLLEISVTNFIFAISKEI